MSSIFFRSSQMSEDFIQKKEKKTIGVKIKRKDKSRSLVNFVKLIKYLTAFNRTPRDSVNDFIIGGEMRHLLFFLNLTLSNFSLSLTSYLSHFL